MTAIEAKSLAERENLVRADFQPFIVLKQIKKEAKRGRYELTVKYLFPATISILESKGYDVRSYLNGYIIRWY